MKNEILRLEKSFLQLQYMNDVNWLNMILHPDFKEFGKSGTMIHKSEVIESLMQCTKDRDITVYNYEFMQVDVNTFLVHYVTKESDMLYYRTSLWVKEERLCLVFHQASKINDTLYLREY